MFSWNIPHVPSDKEATCSPIFPKCGRRWRITFEKRGHQSMFGLKYVQGVGRMHLAVRLYESLPVCIVEFKKYILGNKVMGGVQRFYDLNNLYHATRTLKPFLFYSVRVCSSINLN